jgi:hypothetical protein
MNQNVFNESKLFGNIMYFITLSDYGSIYWFEYGHCSANARDAAAAEAGTLFGTGCAA